jgi:hypothetical protein
MIEQTRLPLRLLTKPRTSVYAQPDTNSPRVEEGLATFTELIATDISGVEYDGANFAPTGWFGVAKVAGQAPIGFVQASDVVEWHNGLVLTYTNPGLTDRKPVIMFSDADALKATVDDLSSGALTSDEFFGRIDSGDIPIGVISREPAAYVDFTTNFYLMPIIGKMDMSLFTPGLDTWALQLAAATETQDGGAQGACDLTSQEVAACDKGTGSIEDLEYFEIVFVIDMTVSMEPYIEAVRTAVAQTATGIQEAFPGGSDKIRFGLVGYRDDVTAVPEMQWTAQSFTSDGLLTADAFYELMQDPQVSAATADNGDFPEEMFPGIYEGIESAWSEGKGARLIILIGDASSHPLGHPRNTMQLSPEMLRNQAQAKNVRIAAIHISRNAEDAPVAEEQMRTVVGFLGESPAYRRIPVDGDAKLTEQLQLSLKAIVEAITGGGLDALAAPVDDDAGAQEAILAAARAAVVDYLGEEAQPPSNLVAWALDRDLATLSTPAFSVKVMVDRRQLEELKNGIESILTAFQAQESTTGDFFAGAQGVSVGTTMDLLGITDTTRLGDADILPSWIKYLPYKSEIAAMSVQDFKDAAPDERRRTEERIERLIAAYDELLARPGAWQALNDATSGDDMVHFIDIVELP